MRLESKQLHKSGEESQGEFKRPSDHTGVPAAYGCAETSGVAAFGRHHQCRGGLSSDAAASESPLLLQITPHAHSG